MMNINFKQDGKRFMPSCLGSLVLTLKEEDELHSSIPPLLTATEASQRGEVLCVIFKPVLWYSVVLWCYSDSSLVAI